MSGTSWQWRGVALALACSSGCVDVAPPPGLRNVVTPLAPESCRRIADGAGATWTTYSCPGVGGYTLRVEEGDSRVEVSVVTPAGMRHDLKFAETVTRGYTALEPQAEWLVEDAPVPAPIAVLLHVTANHDVGTETRSATYLVVSKITPETACVTAKIDDAGDRDAARRDAAKTATRPCLGTAR